VARVAVGAGQRVTTSQTLVVLEAMKIEHLVGSPRDGLVERVVCREGDQVEVGTVLVELEER
jgi:3-methylcrotonyl-CoA carboxylase alpha subunit